LIYLKDIYDVFNGELQIYKKGVWVPLTEGYCKEFDLDLKFGKMGEEFVQGVLEGDSKIEIKTERDKWKETGNIAIEIRYKGKDSGITITEASTWIHLLSYKDDIVGGFILNVKKLKERIKELNKAKKVKIVMGGDDNMSQLVLVPIKEIFELVK
tara:strand:- start:16871 stop:17335 length:465 start_codon:yes stop_codon:yes gene_type:complete